MNKTYNSSNPEKTWVIPSLLVLYLSWSSTYFAIRVALESFPPFFIAGFRYMLVGLGFCLYLRWKGAPWPSLRELIFTHNWG
jgi:drug/metabolite transporter (DMT)-like permease